MTKDVVARRAGSIKRTVLLRILSIRGRGKILISVTL